MIMADSSSGLKNLIESWLPSYLPAGQTPTILHEAMHYALMAGGKRIRPILVLLTNQLLGGTQANAMATACAVEMIHTYSLIHDDLPAMDDDELRRGKPTLHIKFSEAIAILAGDALQSRAFEIITRDDHLADSTQLSLIRAISTAIGPQGMVAGQVLDMEGENRSIDGTALVEMHNRKTGDLISASIMAGACIAGATDAEQQHLKDFGYSLGLAFQIRDDLLDVLGDTETLGKPQGSDQRQDKNTFTSIYGVEGARERLDTLRSRALTSLEPMGARAKPLVELTHFVVERIH
ncbi:MAG: geranylgeranyl diphosphate synthase type II [Patiriisocius sp.]|jgi:geranylgeranyl diphosphate synthase type II